MRLAWVVYGKLLTEQHSIMTLSAILKKERIDSVLIYSNSHKEILKRIGSLSPSVVAYSLMYGSHWKYIHLCQSVRKEFPNIFQVLGGPLATFYPEVLQKLEVDAIGIGEADISLPRLASRLKKHIPIEDTKGFHLKAKNFAARTDLESLCENLDELPFPDRELFYEQDPLLKNQEFKSFLSGRGCPYPCTYCFNHQFNQMYKGLGRIIRKKSVAYFIEEIAQVKSRYGCQFAIFEDDIFVMNLGWLEEFARRFKEQIGIPYICYVRADLVNENILKLLKASGCYIVRMAIESGNEKIRNTILKRNMTNKTIVDACDLIHSFGLKLSVSNMIGLPTETISSLHDTVKLNQRCRPDHPTAQFFMPYPRMELTQIAIQTGYFDEKLLSTIPKNTWKFTPLLFDQRTKRLMEKTQKLFPFIVKYPRLQKLWCLCLRLPNNILYVFSIFAKILIVKGYFPQTKVKLTQRIGVLFRFLKFYG